MKAWAIFVHSIRQVFGNLPEALQITALIYLAQMAVSVALGAMPNAMAAPAFSKKWASLKRAERDFTGVRLAEFPDVAAEAQGIALALRQVLEVPGRTAAIPARLARSTVS